MKLFLKNKSINSKITNNLFNSLSNGWKLQKNGYGGMLNKRGINNWKIGMNKISKYTTYHSNIRYYSTEDSDKIDETSEYERKMQEKKEKERKRREEYTETLKNKKLEEMKEAEAIQKKNAELELEKRIPDVIQKEKDRKIKVSFDAELLITYLKQDSQVNRILELLLQRFTKTGQVSKEELQKLGFPPFVETVEEALRWTRETEERKQLWYMFLSVMMDVKQNSPSWRDQVWVLLDAAKSEEEKRLWTEMYHMEKRYEDILLPADSMVRNTLSSIIKTSIRSKKRLEDFRYGSDYLREGALGIFGNIHSNFEHLMKDPIEKRMWYRAKEDFDKIISEENKQEMLLSLEPTFYPDDAPRQARPPAEIKEELKSLKATLSSKKSIGSNIDVKAILNRITFLRTEFRQAKLDRRKNLLGVPLKPVINIGDNILLRLYNTFIGNYRGYFYLVAALFGFLYYKYAKHKEVYWRKSNRKYESGFDLLFLEKLPNFVMSYVSKDPVFLHNMGREVFFHPRESRIQLYGEDDHIYVFLPIHGKDRTAYVTGIYETVPDWWYGTVAYRPINTFVDFSDSTSYFIPVEDDQVFTMDTWNKGFEDMKFLKEGETAPNYLDNRHGLYDYGYCAPPTRFVNNTLLIPRFTTVKPKDTNFDSSFYFSHFANPDFELPNRKFREIKSFLSNRTDLDFLNVNDLTEVQVKRLSFLLDLQGPQKLHEMPFYEFVNLMDPDMSDNDVQFYFNNQDFASQQEDAFRYIQEAVDRQTDTYLEEDFLDVDQLPLIRNVAVSFSRDKLKPSSESLLLENIQYLSENVSFRSAESENNVVLWRKTFETFDKHKRIPLAPNDILNHFPSEYFLNIGRIYDKYDVLVNNDKLLPFVSPYDKKQLLSDFFDGVMTVYPTSNYIKWEAKRPPFFIEQLFPSTYFTTSKSYIDYSEKPVVIEDDSRVEEILELRNIAEEEMVNDPSLKNAVFYHLNKHLANKTDGVRMRAIPRHAYANEIPVLSILPATHKKNYTEDRQKTTEFFP